MYKIWGMNTVVWGIKCCYKYLVTVYKIWAATQTASESHHLECLSYFFGPLVALLQLTECSQHEQWCQRRDRSESHLCLWPHLLSAGWQMKPHTSHPGCSCVQGSCIAPGVMNGSILVGRTTAGQQKNSSWHLYHRGKNWIMKDAQWSEPLFLLPSLLRIFALRNT